jgi:phage-related protein
MYEVEFWENENGKVHVGEFIKNQKPEVQEQLINALKNLRNLGHDLREPQVKYLGKQIYELRERNGRVHYRLYFFYDGSQIVITHGVVTDHKKVNVQIEYAVDCRNTYMDQKRKKK